MMWSRQMRRAFLLVTCLVFVGMALGHQPAWSLESDIPGSDFAVDAEDLPLDFDPNNDDEAYDATSELQNFEGLTGEEEAGDAEGADTTGDSGDDTTSSGTEISNTIGGAGGCSLLL